MATGRRQLLFIITGSQVKGLGQSLKALDTDTIGNDDLAGNIAVAAGEVLVGLGSGNVNSIEKALELNIQASQAYLDALREPPV